VPPCLVRGPAATGLRRDGRARGPTPDPPGIVERVVPPRGEEDPGERRARATAATRFPRRVARSPAPRRATGPRPGCGRATRPRPLAPAASVRGCSRLSSPPHAVAARPSSTPPGTSPRQAATGPGRANRSTSSRVARYASAVTRLLDTLGAEAEYIDAVVRRAEVPPDEALEMLLALELRGLVEQCSGSRFRRRAARERIGHLTGTPCEDVCGRAPR
jgi:hypothetical protein